MAENEITQSDVPSVASMAPATPSSSSTKAIGAGFSVDVAIAPQDQTHIPIKSTSAPESSPTVVNSSQTVAPKVQARQSEVGRDPAAENIVEYPTANRHDAEAENRRWRIIDAQMALLREEIIQINTSIRQIDEITKSVKQWAIISTTATLSFLLRDQVLHKYLWLAAMAPILFWFVDVSYRRIQRRLIFRMRRIGEFATGDLPNYFSAPNLGRLTLLDPLSMREDDQQAEDFSSFGAVAKFPTVTLLYAGLFIIGVLLSIFTKLQ